VVTMVGRAEPSLPPAWSAATTPEDDLVWFDVIMQIFAEAVGSRDPDLIYTRTTHLVAVYRHLAEKHTRKLITTAARRSFDPTAKSSELFRRLGGQVNSADRLSVQYQARDLPPAEDPCEVGDEGAASEEEPPTA
jgi:hypothetical protein